MSIRSALATLVFSLFGVSAAEGTPGSQQYYPKINIPLNEVVTNADSALPEMAGLDNAMNQYLATWELKGLSLAIVRNDSLVFAKGYGWADIENRTRMEPNMLLRVASVSKLITAAGIMVLRDRGQLDLDTKVFGPEGLLAGEPYKKVQNDTSFQKINVEMLLRHQGGFRSDPIFSTETVQKAYGLEREPKGDDYIRYGLGRGLAFEPGTSQSYSNLGYVLLSRIIETISEQDYEQFIIDNVLEPAGCYDIHIAGNTEDKRRANEVKYYSHDTKHESYGMNDLVESQGAGGWCASTLEIAKFVCSIDGRYEVPDIMSRRAVDEMTYYDPEHPEWFAFGWNDTNPETGWSRTGTLTGTSALVKKFPDGECWILVTNTSTWKGARFTKESAALFDECRAKYSHLLPHRDLFYWE